MVVLGQWAFSYERVPLQRRGGAYDLFGVKFDPKHPRFAQAVGQDLFQDRM